LLRDGRAGRGQACDPEKANEARYHRTVRHERLPLF
jgi:hypothetical protein